MAYSKVILNGTTLIDVTQKTVDASNLLSGYTALKNDGTNVTGTYEPQTVNLQAKTNITPTLSSQTITADTGYDGLSSVQINAISPNRTENDVVISGKNITVQNGYYQTQVNKSVASGTQGTPTATKGTVSYHAVDITPSVTNTAGWITGGTKTGTAVRVSASELVSGTLPITANGITNVANWEYVNVDVSGGGGGDGRLYIFFGVGYVNAGARVGANYLDIRAACFGDALVSGATVTFFTYGDYILGTVTGETSGNTIPFTTVTRGTYTFTMPDESVYCELEYDD